jgi:hypothetical protein
MYQNYMLNNASSWSKYFCGLFEGDIGTEAG